MLNLPPSTEVKRPLPKAQLYMRFDWKPSQRDSFDGDVARLDFVNWIAPRTLPAIAEGIEVKEIFVVEVTLKTRDFDIKNITLLAKSIPQHIVYLFRYEDEYKIAVYYTRLFITPWQNLDDDDMQHAGGIFLQLNGLNLDSVWENIVRQIMGASLCNVSSTDASHIKQAEGTSLQDQIIANDERAKIERQITSLERQMYSAKQPRRKREIFEQLRKLKLQL